MILYPVDHELQIILLPDGGLDLEWTDAADRMPKSRDILQREFHRRFTEAPEAALLFLGLSDPTVTLSPSLEFWRGIVSLFIKRLTQTPELEALRHRVDVPLPEAGEADHVLAAAPLMTGYEYLNSETLRRVWGMLDTAFSREIKGYAGTVEDFFKTYSPSIHLVGRVYFHLVENKKDGFPFAFLATYSTGLTKEGTSRHLPLKYAIEEHGKDSAKLLDLLSTVHTASKESALVAGILESGEIFHPLAWTSGEAYTFLKEVSLYEKSGILCRIPDWWKGQAVGVRLSVTIGEATPSFVGMDALLAFDAGILLGDTRLSYEEALRLLASAEGLALIKNKWVAVDHERLKQSLAAYEEAAKLSDEGGLSLRDAMRLRLNPAGIFKTTGGDAGVEVSKGEWLASVVRRMRDPGLLESTHPSKPFRAELRPYQQKGVDWLRFLYSLGFGMCLADDMGLGKTVQMLALLSFDKGKAVRRASLLVLPASLIANWEAEIRRFAPALSFYIAHPGARPDKKVCVQSAAALDKLDLVITTYAMAQRYEWIHGYEWDLVILDEAQAIKNPGTKQTKAVKKLRARNRVVMTGTPVENRLSDLWSLFDFINPGLLGTTVEFGDFCKSLSKRPEGYARLREVCETILEKREKALVFTQFQEVTGPLKAFLEGVFGRPGLVLHGGTPVSKRKDLVERFQSGHYVPFMVLSLKAGGVGLNLTAANHVIHFDRWWNPAVENQATDRAFRIGQKRNVVVHKFISRGTIEEKIDAMIEEKTRLSQEVIRSSGEEWITEMDNKELINLFSLSL